MDRDTFIRRQLELLEREREAEIEEVERLRAELPDAELERRGLTLRRLTLRDLDVGLGGRTLLVLEPSRGGELPAHRFAVGDLVALREGRDDEAARIGVVDSVRRESIRIAVDEGEDDPDLPNLIRLDRLVPDVTFRRMRDAIQALATKTTAEQRNLRRAALGENDPGPLRPLAKTRVGEHLDASQREAVAAALEADPLALIHGPPGTGKTTAVVELIRLAALRGERVLATAPSNVAVDNLAERLAAAGVRIVRVGHPARLLPQVRALSLDAQVAEVEDTRLVRDLRRDIGVVERRLARASGRDERRDARQELRRLRAEIRALDAANVALVLGRAEVVLTTTTGAEDRHLRGAAFDLIVVDEAAQALEAATWIPLHKGRRAVLAGDHRQLPPTIVSDAAARGGLAKTLFEKLADAHGETIVRMLTVQYRMHATIMEWSSTAMYEGRLTAAASVAAHRLADIEGAAECEDTVTPFLWIDTAGCGFEETADVHDGSKSNPDEARLVSRHVRALLDAGVEPNSIGVITPYNAQVQALRDTLADLPELEIGTVDGFQGREKEAIVLSLVRSNDRGDVGFLAERRRMNVAVTRARRQVALIGDTATLACDPFLAGLIEHAQRSGAYRSAFEYGDL
ncbi:MAG: IGHMBP2 family helicase [Planctomycetota bacterium]|nr:IGHMBP2 family helicase [Planctomycetota bacterium]MDA0933977.1 IGHMBP2 family helicase [Planctomycetota bacterium]MDA1221950.1 IGHMBP2 family helicase [Planctomycetota bacterium]